MNREGCEEGAGWEGPSITPSAASSVGTCQLRKVPYGEGWCHMRKVIPYEEGAFWRGDQSQVSSTLGRDGGEVEEPLAQRNRHVRRLHLQATRGGGIHHQHRESAGGMVRKDEWSTRLVENNRRESCTTSGAGCRSPFHANRSLREVVSCG